MKEDPTFYYIVWVIVLILALAERIRRKPFNNTIITIVFMVAAVIVACRVEVGADWDSYKFFYYNGYSQHGRDDSTIEPVYFFLRNIFYYFGVTHAVFFLFLSFVSLVAIRKAAELFEVKYFMTVFLIYFSMFFLNYQFNIVRHGIMASFVWLCFAYKSKGQIKTAIITIIIALGFHVAAIVFVPFVFFLDRKISKSLVFIILAISYLIFLIQLSARIISYFPFLYELERTASYFTSNKYVVDHGLTMGNLIQVLLFLFLYFKYSDSYKKKPGFRLLVNSLLFNFFLICILNAFYAIISRICNTLFMTVIFLLPFIIETIKKPVNRLVAESLIVIYLLFSSLPKAFVVQEDGHSEMLPYKFEIEQLIDEKAK